MTTKTKPRYVLNKNALQHYLIDHDLTQDEVMEAWNLRDVESRPERTCHPVIEDETKVCSNCGYDIDGYGWRYCPNCGARIVEQ